MKRLFHFLSLSFIFSVFSYLLYKKVLQEEMFRRKTVLIYTSSKGFSSCYLCTRTAKYGIIIFILLFCYRGVVYE